MKPRESDLNGIARGELPLAEPFVVRRGFGAILPHALVIGGSKCDTPFLESVIIQLEKYPLILYFRNGCGERLSLPGKISLQHF